ncbi:(2Fe-2S)-binding protein [Streptomyces sp. NPDC052012]|uniref:(2Fe-2S)-binding protein n=1 Tax=Streptomyces sp. NPDC052012 TaxID=3155051 RepID=UPI00344FAC44
MTAPVTARAPEGAVAAALEDVAPLGGFFALTVGGPDHGWHPVTDTYAGGLTDLAEAVADRYGTRETRIGVSVVQLGHAARLWSPVLAGTLLHGIVPDLADLHRADDTAALRLPAPTGWYADRIPHLTDALYELVVEQHLAPLAAGLRIKISPRLLDGNAASALAGTAQVLLTARPDLRGPLTELTTALLATGRLAGTGHFTGPDLSFRRRSCCLLYRTSTGTTCGDCCLAR